MATSDTAPTRTATATKDASVFSLRVPLLSEGRSDKMVAKSDDLTVRMKIYAEGGENATHAHSHEDHCFVVLQGEATFYLGVEERPQVVGPLEGIHLPPGAYYRFQSTGDVNLALLRFGAWNDRRANQRLGPDGEPLPGGSTRNKGIPPVEIEGAHFGDGWGPSAE